MQPRRNNPGLVLALVLLVGIFCASANAGSLTLHSRGRVPIAGDTNEWKVIEHTIEWDGVMKEMYHYHVNNQFPYSIGCFRGTPIELPEHLQH